MFFVDGFILPGTELINVTLSCAIQEMKEKMENVPINSDLYRLPKNLAFEKIYDIVYTEEDYRYELSPQELGDRNCFIFAVGNGEAVRILAGEMHYDKETSRHDFHTVSIKETAISCDEFHAVADRLSD